VNLDTFWSLPSPKRWLDEVVNKINEEHLCVLQAPSVSIESFGIKDKCESTIRESIHWSTSSAVFAIESDSFPKNYPEFLDQVKDWYGLTIEHGSNLDQIVNELKDKMAHPILILDTSGLNFSQVQNIIKFVNDYVYGCNSLNFDIGFLVILGFFSEEESLHSAISVVGPIKLHPVDVYLYVYTQALKLSKRILSGDEVLLWIYVEVCMFDLELTDLLIEKLWNGSLDEMHNQVLVSALNRRRNDYSGINDMNELDLLNNGIVQKWGTSNSPKKLLWANDESQTQLLIQRAIWRAQLREMFHRLEEMRSSIILYSRRESRTNFIDAVEGMAKSSGGVFETADLSILTKHSSRLPEMEELLRVMGSVRNKLAHQKIVPLRDWKNLEREWKSIRNSGRIKE
jgi:hypothetical protein